MEILTCDDKKPVAWTTMPDAQTWDFVSGSDNPNGKLSGIWMPLYTVPVVNRTPDANELWAAAQLVPGESIIDGVMRIEELMATTPQSAQQEPVTAWLIKMVSTSRPMWFCLNSKNVAFMGVDANNALRFSRKVDAESMLSFLLELKPRVLLREDNYRCAEHMWIDAAPGGRV